MTDRTANATIHPATGAGIPGYAAGTWLIDPVHSDASFTARHLVGKVRGRFRDLSGEIRTSEDPLGSSVTVTIEAASVDTGNAQRDDHLRSPDFLDAGKYPTLSFTSTRLRQGGGSFLIDGDLTIKDVTRPITADLEVNGFTPDQDGTLRAGYTATFQINRKDYNVNFHWILETGGAMAGDQITIHLEVEAILQQH